MTFPYSQPTLLNICRNWEHGIEYISQNWWSNFHEISILLPKSHTKIRKNTIVFQGKNIRLSNFQDHFFSKSFINCGNLKEFEIFNWTPIRWLTMEWFIKVCNHIPVSCCMPKKVQECEESCSVRPPLVEMLFIVIFWCLCEYAACSNYGLLIIFSSLIFYVGMRL